MINLEHMEMYADPESRGGVLEPSGTVEIKYRKRDLIITMHRLDSKLKELDTICKQETNRDAKIKLQTEIELREIQLLPTYEQIARQFADLHDTPGRMLAKGVIKNIIAWKDARTFFYWRLKRATAESRLRKKITQYCPGLSIDLTTDMLKKWYGKGEWDNDKEVINWLKNESKIEERLTELRKNYLQTQVRSLLASKAEAEIALDELLNILVTDTTRRAELRRELAEKLKHN